MDFEMNYGEFIYQFVKRPNNLSIGNHVDAMDKSCLIITLDK